MSDPGGVTENSPAGLTLFAPDVEVAVTREEYHQPALQAYAPTADGRPRKVVVELRFAPLEAADVRGKSGIEVRLDGRRVGELDAQMSARYGTLLEDVLLLGLRPACIAQVVHGPRGVQVELRLPTIDVSVAVPPEPPHPVSVGAPPVRRRTPYLVGAGVAALLIVVGLSVGRGNDTVPTADGAGVVMATTTAAAAPTSTTPVPVPVETARRSVAPSSPRPAPQPAPQAAEAPEAAPEAAPEPSDDCDPNYGDCVPVADDVDCADDGDDGPLFVTGPVEITGTDVYDLDPDGDGIGCD